MLVMRFLAGMVVTFHPAYGLLHARMPEDVEKMIIRRGVIVVSSDGKIRSGKIKKIVFTIHAASPRPRYRESFNFRMP